jgi:hypothetical protein
MFTTDYEKLHAHMGDEQFDSLIESYISRYPSNTPNLGCFSIKLPELRVALQSFSAYPVLQEIAIIERAFANTFDAGDRPFASLADLEELNPESWEN